MSKKNLKDLKYGRPSEKHIKKMKKQTDLIPVDSSSINISLPPENDSELSRSEIHHIKKALSANNYDSRRVIDIADADPVSMFVSFAIDNGLRYDEEYLKDISNQLQPLILKLKYKFNRPRPFQLARALQIPFDPVEKESASTPSYPSGHSAQAYVLSNILSKYNPGYEREIENIADQISLSRFQAGVHYPSDLAAGKEVANIIEPEVAGMEEYRGIMTELDFRTVTRNFLNESYVEEPEKLRVLDFDDTIANTAESVIITTADGEGEKLISSEEFAVYDLSPGESINPETAFRQFDKVDIDSASPVPFVSDLLKTFADASGDRKILILTARSQVVADDVMSFLEKRLGISDPSGKIDFRGVANKDPAAKVEVIKEYLDAYPTINFVSFYDDSGKNVKAVHEFLDQRGFSRGRDQRDVRQVVKDEEGNTSLVKYDHDSMSESRDFRLITRSFLMSLF